LEYLTQSGWTSAQTLVALSGCAVLSDSSISNPYGVVSLGPNHIIAGSDIPLAHMGDLLWTSDYVTLNVEADQNAIVAVRVLTNTSTYSGSFFIQIPRSTFAYVWLESTQIPSAGLLGDLGATDQFQKWTGDVETSNSSIRILMDHDGSISTRWTTDYSGMIGAVLTVTIGILLVALVLLALNVRRRKKLTKRLSTSFT
jgi:hypothetical protein